MSRPMSTAPKPSVSRPRASGEAETMAWTCRRCAPRATASSTEPYGVKRTCEEDEVVGVRCEVKRMIRGEKGDFSCKGGFELQGRDAAV